MTVLVGLAAIAAFVVAFAWSGLVGAAGEAVATAQGAGRVMRDPGLDDTAKERAVRRASLAMFRSFGEILLRGLAVIAAAALPLLLADVTGAASAEAVTDWLMRIDVIVGASVVVVLGLYTARRFWRTR